VKHVETLSNRRDGTVRRAANPAQLRCNRRVGYFTAENAEFGWGN